MSVMVVVAGQRFPKDGSPLPDLGFEFLPVGTHNEHIPNNILFICLLSSLTRFIFHKKGLTIIRRFMIVHGISALLRCATLVTTSYPDPSQVCRGYQPADTPAVFLKTVVTNTALVTCGDLMPSGHTLVFVILALSWHKHTKYMEKCFFWVLALAGCLSLIITRMHYTNDVLIAIYEALTTFYIYHVFATDPMYRRKSFFLNWLEAELVEDVEAKRLVDRHVNIVFTV